VTGPLLLAVDASTSAVKALVFDAEGYVLSEGRFPLELESPEPNAYEQDANTWWEATLVALREATQALTPSQRALVGALCVTHQRETVVVTDSSGEPLAKAIVWMDVRCRDEVKRAERALGGGRLHEVSGKPACTTPSLYKLMHLFSRRPELATEGHVADVHAFLARRLVGRTVSSLASADPTGLVDMHDASWSEPLCALLGVGSEKLPELVPVGTKLGTLARDVAEATGLPSDLVVYAGAGDGQAACLGAGIVEPGRAYLNLGTAVVLGVVTPRYEIGRAFRTLFAASGGHYCLESDLKGGTFTVTWLLEKLLGRTVESEALAELEEAASTLPPGSDGLVLLPYWCGVMNPYWDDDATGLLLGLHGAHGASHVYRALLEGIALEQRLGLEGMQAATGETIEELVLMGGGSKSDLWCQILADVLGRPLVRAETSEATALGAAMIAAVGHGVHSSHDAAARAMTRAGRRFLPGTDRAFYDTLYRDVYQGLFEDVQKRMRRLAELRQGHGARRPR
jgi:xylulokinase